MIIRCAEKANEVNNRNNPRPTGLMRIPRPSSKLVLLFPVSITEYIQLTTGILYCKLSKAISFIGVYKN